MYLTLVPRVVLRRPAGWRGHPHLVSPSRCQVCQKELLGMDSLGLVLPYLQHLPPQKMTRSLLMSNVCKINPSKLDNCIAQLDAQMTKAKAKEAKENATRKRTRESTGKGSSGLSTPSAKRKRPAANANAPPTPSVFRRFIDSLPTPLRRKARDDGAQTPKPRSRVLRPMNAKASTKSAAHRAVSSLQTPKREFAQLGERSPLLGIPREACSPSFGRSGVLSPSFKGTVVLTPM